MLIYMILVNMVENIEKYLKILLITKFIVFKKLNVSHQFKILEFRELTSEFL